MTNFAYTVNHLGDMRTTGLPARWGSPCPACGVMGATDAYGLPQLSTPAGPIDWNDSRSHCFNTAGAPSNCSDESQYRIQDVIDRQCTAIAGVTPQIDTGAAENCLVINTDDSREFKRSDRMLFPPPKPIVYRATVHVRGPRNTSSLVQASLTF